MSDVQHIKHFDMSDAVKRARDRWLEEAGIAVTAQSRALLVKGHGLKTGLLKGSIGYRVTGDDCEVGTNVEYAPYVEYGTKRWPSGAAFLRPGLREAKKKLIARWNVLLKGEAHA